MREICVFMSLRLRERKRRNFHLISLHFCFLFATSSVVCCVRFSSLKGKFFLLRLSLSLSVVLAWNLATYL